MPRPAIEVAPRVSWLWLVGMQQGREAGLVSKAAFGGSRQALCLRCGATPWKEKLKLSKCHPRPLPTPPTIHYSEASEGGAHDHPSPSSTVVEACLCSILSPASLVPGKLLPPNPQS